MNILHLRRCLVWIFLLCVASTGAMQPPHEPTHGHTVCEVTQYNEEPGNTTVVTDTFMSCPRPGDPSNYTACCYDEVEVEVEVVEGGEGGGVGEERVIARCCPPPPAPSGLFYIDDQLAMIIALSVTSACVIATVIIIVCCFWSRCPLYTTCRIRYHQDDIIAYASKDDETAGLNDMPPEEKKGVNVYSPNAVKVTMKDDV